MVRRDRIVVFCLQIAVLLQLTSAHDLSASRGAKHIECRLVETFLLEAAKGEAREGTSFVRGNEGDGATAEITSGAPGARSASLARGLYESILKGAYSALFDLPQEVPLSPASPVTRSFTGR